MREAEAAEIDQRARPEVVDDRNAMLARQPGKLARRYLCRKAGDQIVGRVDLEDQAGFGANRLRIVLRMRPIGSTDFDELRARPRHDIRDAEWAADLE